MSFPLFKMGIDIFKVSQTEFYPCHSPSPSSTHLRLDEHSSPFFPVQQQYNITRPICTAYMTTQQSGMQHTQQSNPPQSQSRHLVLPGAAPPGLMIELVAEPGRTKLTGLEMDPVHMALEGREDRHRRGKWVFQGTIRDAQTLFSSCTRHVPLFIYICIYL